MITQKLEQKLLQKLSPQQIQLMKLLQVPTAVLEQRIKQEIEENPALEFDDMEEDDNMDIESDVVLNTQNEAEQEENASEEDKFDDIDIEDYFDEDDIPEYKLYVNNSSKDEENKQAVFVSGTTFHDYLVTQLGWRNLTSKQRLIGEVVIGNIDDSGYLQRDASAIADDIAFSFNVEAKTEEVQEIIDLIKQFDPPGVGASGLQECLLIQIKNINEQTSSVQLAINIIENYFEDFIHKHYDKILKKVDISEEELKNATEVILKLNPKPGNTIFESDKNNPDIIPDFFVTNNDGKLELTLDSRNAPDIRISRRFQEMLETYSDSSNKKTRNKEIVNFVRQKIDSAKWFIEAIKQRQNTLYVTMEAIMNFQKDYFLTGDERLIKPMILKDIADIVNMDISTVSRVANSKYVQTSFGTFLLKVLFSESLQTDKGEEVSSREVKKILSDCIDSENKRNPFTDEQLAGLLKEKGYNIARRTVAKYREMLNIPVARLRKEL